MINEFIQTNPRISIGILAMAVSFFISAINSLLLDKVKVKGMKNRQKEINKQIKENKHDQEKMMELQKELLSHSMENMKHSFKPMLITLIPVLIVFNWIRESFSSTIISSSWLWYYLGFALFFSIFFRKLFKLP
jgi:uncharacterized membrane protein (DUF106 family)